MPTQALPPGTAPGAVLPSLPQSTTLCKEARYVLLQHMHIHTHLLSGIHCKKLSHTKHYVLLKRMRTPTNYLSCPRRTSAQGRYRCIIWGAAPGHVLPSLPEPTTRCVDFHTAMPANAKVCVGTMLAQ